MPASNWDPGKSSTPASLIHRLQKLSADSPVLPSSLLSMHALHRHYVLRPCAARWHLANIATHYIELDVTVQASAAMQVCSQGKATKTSRRAHLRLV